MKLGIFTVSTPEWTPDEMFSNLRRIGYDGIEWRVCEDKGDRTKPSFWSGNRTTMTAAEIIARAGELKAKARSASLEMPALAAYINCLQKDQILPHLKATAAIGARCVRIGAPGYPAAQGGYVELLKSARAAYAEVARMAADLGVRAVIETHMGQLAPTVARAMDILDGLDPRHVGIMWDPGNQVTEGSEVSRMAVETAGPYLAEVHVKNAKWVSAGQERGQTMWKTTSCPIQEGVVNWPAVLDVLKQSGYDGWLFFEDFSTDQPMEARITANLRWFRSLLA